MTLDDLKARLESFSPAQIEFVATVVASLSNPPRSDIQTQGTWLTGIASWIEYFGLALSVHHSATTAPLGLTAFETVFRNACCHVGWAVDTPITTTQRFVDLTVQASSGPLRRLSLKSTAARNLSEHLVHISKLTEGAWIQDQRTATGRRNQTLELFRKYQAAVSAIIMLRAFRSSPDATPYRYQLLEIPANIFDAVHSAP